MYLAVDIGGTKTLIAAFSAHGEVIKKLKFPTPVDYDEFISELSVNIPSLGDIDYRAACVACPGRINRHEGIAVASPNLPWKNVPLGVDVEGVINAPVIVENDAKLAGLSEAILIKEEFNKVLYITVSTGIGTAIITDGHIDPDFINMEGGIIPLEHNGKVQSWESFASGRAIKRKYGKLASEIEDKGIWQEISRNLAIGLIDVLAIVQPDVVVIGGGVGTHFRKFRAPLMAELRKYETPLIPVPPIRQAERSEEAVVYGCYYLAKEKYGHTSK